MRADLPTASGYVLRTTMSINSFHTSLQPMPCQFRRRRPNQLVTYRLEVYRLQHRHRLSLTMQVSLGSVQTLAITRSCQTDHGLLRTRHQLAQQLRVEHAEYFALTPEHLSKEPYLPLVLLITNMHRRHVARQHEARMVCQLCDKSFTSSRGLARHERTACKSLRNKGTSAQRCICGKSYKRRDDVLRHIRTTTKRVSQTTQDRLLEHRLVETSPVN